jgi:N-acetylmuramoyl-L-alanine amidase
MHRKPRIAYTSRKYRSNRKPFALAIVSCLVLAGCGSPQSWHSSPLASAHVASPNWGERRFDLIVLHHTGESSFSRALATLTDSKSGVSAHYLISRTGQITQLVDERDRAWHAGASRFGPIDDVNSVSLGIELDNDGHEPFADAQISALLRLLEDVTARYGIDPRNVVGHADVAPLRKTDPSRFFPWAILAQHGFGLWCDANTSPGADAGTATSDESVSLRLIGYQVSNDKELAAARHAFKLHFASVDDFEPLNSEQRTLLACIARASEKPARTALPINLQQEQ